MIESSDPYVYPGTNVLKNLRDIRDPGSLARFEAEATARRITELIAQPVQGSFDRAHLKAIHRYAFQDVFSWAGQFRTVNISKGGHLFGAAPFIEPALDRTLGQLPREGYLRNTEPGSFAERAGFYLGEINAVHPFREGNGRAQREFIRELGLEAGFVVDWSRAGRDEMIRASQESAATGASAGLAALIRVCMPPELRL